MSVWKAFWQKGERYKRADGSMSKNWVAYCFECEAAHEKYRGAVAACNGEDEAIANIGIVPPAEPLSGPADWMAPHLTFIDLGAVTGIGSERIVLDAKEGGYVHEGVATANEVASVIDGVEQEGYFPIGCNFWSELAAAETIIRPIAKASFVFERDDATMADAIGIYGCLFHHLASACTHCGRARLCDNIKRRWAQDEQVIFLLAFCLHPHYMRAARALLSQDRRATPMSFFSAPCLADASAA
eukprot:contig_2860_g580